MNRGFRSRYISRYVNLKFRFLPFVVASIVAMVFLRRICSSRPGDWEQRRQSVAALTARGRGLDCLQPQPRQPVLRAGRTLCVYAERSAWCSLPRLPTLCFPLARPASTRSSRTARAFPLCGVARIADIKLPKCIEKICPSTIPPEKTTG